MEIGSEFWLNKEVEETENVKNCNNRIFFLSGRTSIDYVLHLLEKNNKIKSVYFPSYCCDSMIKPFTERNIRIDFYNVVFENGKLKYEIDLQKKCDVFFAMNYFGICANNMDYYINKFKEQNIYIIEDSTHSWLSQRMCNPNSDFVIVSIRKWLPVISGAMLLIQTEQFQVNDFTEIKDTNYQYVATREKAMIKKGKYMKEHFDSIKDEFLNEFNNAAKILEEDYKGYCMDDKSYTLMKNTIFEDVINKRKNNAKVIYNFLENQNQIDYIKGFKYEQDCPIFVPIFLKKEYRDALKKELINKRIYCPCHWQIPGCIKNTIEKNIYNIELSLICDQRYNADAIEKYLKLIQLYAQENIKKK